MVTIADFRKTDNKIIILGSHPGIIQSVLDYDFLVGKQQPSVIAIIATGRRHERYFWGETEVIIPVIGSLAELDRAQREACTAVINVQSARRVLSATTQAVDLLPHVRAVVLFAELTPERHALQIKQHVEGRDIVVIGPSSVGLLVPGFLKLGAIGGTQHRQLVTAGILKSGDTAVVSTSGGIVNELIHTVTGAGLGVSFALAMGGDRFPATSPAEAMLLAEADRQTERIVYFGELGGTDEYEIVQLIKEGKLTKEIIAYVAGAVAELFESPPQFGHAKALAQSQDESASAKKNALREQGVTVCETFADVEKNLLKYGSKQTHAKESPLGERKRSMLVSHLSGERQGDMQLLGKDLLQTVEENTIASLLLSVLLGAPVTSQKAIEFTDYAFRLLVDHGPSVSGAVNTIITARAGKDLVSSLTAGLLTIGPRFGGAINAAAEGWLRGAGEEMPARDYIGSFAHTGGIIPGIGHKKYRIDAPDPRVQALKQFAGNANGDRYLNFALSVERMTVTKKGNLILNVDGAIAAILLDIFESELGYGPAQLQELVDIEFFNALFVLSRSIGFAGHYLDQRRHDEGLFRMPEEDTRYLG